MASTPRAYDTTPLPKVGATACPADEPWVPLRMGRCQPTDPDGSHNTTAVPPLLLLDMETEAAGEGRDRATIRADSFIHFNPHDSYVKLGVHANPLILSSSPPNSLAGLQLLVLQK